jgi:N-glycosylase/DNA lyase
VFAGRISPVFPFNGGYMTTKHKIEHQIIVHAERIYGTSEFKFMLFSTDMSEYGYTAVMPVTVDVEFEIPEDFNLTQAEINALRAQKKKIADEAARNTMLIEERIQSLLAIEYKP